MIMFDFALRRVVPAIPLSLALWCGSLGVLEANLVRNGAFTEPGAVTTPQPPISRPDNRIPSWRMRAEWYIDESVAPPFEGARVLRVEGGDEHRDLVQSVYLEAGKRYTLSAWIRAKGLTKVATDNTDHQTGVLVTNWRWTEKAVLRPDGADQDDWKRYRITFVTPEPNIVGGVEQPSLVRVFVPKGEKGTLWISGIQIEEGTELGEFQFVSTPERNDAAAKMEKHLTALKVTAGLLEGFEGLSKGGIQKEVSDACTALEGAISKVKGNGPLRTAEWITIREKVNTLCADAARYSQPFAWWQNAWENLPLKGLPGEAAAVTQREVKIVRAVNDYGALALPVANLTGATIPVEVKVGDKVAPFSTQSSFDGPIKVSTSYWVSNEGYVSSLSPVKEHQSFPYYLQPLPSSNVTVLPANETTQLWFDVDTKGMQPGTYRYPVTLIGLNADYRWEGQIELTVLPVTLPEKVPSSVMGFFTMPLYMQPFSPHSAEAPIRNFTPEERETLARPWLDIWKEMGFNRLMLTNQYVKYQFDDKGELSAPVDYSIFDAYHTLFSEVGDTFWAGYNLGAYHIYKNHRDLSKIRFNAQSRKRTESVLKSFLDHARSVGLTPDTMPISLFDEPHGKRVDVTRQGVEALKKVAPDWKVMAAIAGTEKRHIEDLVPLLDIFVVRQRMGQMDMKPETIQYLQNSGKEVWGYACSGSFEYLHPYRYFRLLPWQSWSSGLTGYGLYMTILHDAYPNLSARSSYFSPIFLGRDGPVAGRGARGFQAGSRDWTVFTMARELLEQRKKAGGDTGELESLLSDSLSDVVKDEEDSSQADRVREELLREIVRLKGEGN